MAFARAQHRHNGASRGLCSASSRGQHFSAVFCFVLIRFFLLSMRKCSTQFLVLSLSFLSCFILYIYIFSIIIVIIISAGTHRMPQTLCNRNSTSEHFPLEQNSFAGKCFQGSLAAPGRAVRDGDTASVLPLQPCFAPLSGYTYSTHSPCISLKICPCRTSP